MVDEKTEKKIIKKTLQKVGRPSKLTKTRKEELLKAIRAGNTLEASCGYAGIDYSTLAKWVQKSKPKVDEQGNVIEPPRELVEFFEELTCAREEAEVRLISIISTAAQRDWRAAAHLAACRNPYWSERHRLDVTAKPEGEVDQHELDRRMLDRIEADPDAAAALFRLTATCLNDNDASRLRKDSIER